jgi:elongation factor G
VQLELRPMSTDERLEYEDESKGDEIPLDFKGAVEDGIEEAMGAGTLGGYPAVGIRCTVTGGSFHEVDSSDVAFKVAAGMAFQNAFNAGKPVLLEPVMAAEVVTPEQYFGDVVNDLTTRRAQIVEVKESAGDTKTVELRVPLANMFGYATALRSLTQGRATYSMEPHSYEPVPADQQEELLA